MLHRTGWGGRKLTRGGRANGTGRGISRVSLSEAGQVVGRLLTGIGRGAEDPRALNWGGHPVRKGQEPLLHVEDVYLAERARLIARAAQADRDPDQDVLTGRERKAGDGTPVSGPVPYRVDPHDRAGRGQRPQARGAGFLTLGSDD